MNFMAIDISTYILFKSLMCVYVCITPWPSVYSHISVYLWITCVGQNETKIKVNFFITVLQTDANTNKNRVFEVRDFFRISHTFLWFVWIQNFSIRFHFNATNSHIGIVWNWWANGFFLTVYEYIYKENKKNADVYKLFYYSMQFLLSVRSFDIHLSGFIPRRTCKYYAPIR